MARLRIPSQHISGLKELLTLEDHPVDFLAKALEEAPPTLSRDDFQEFVTEKFGESCSASAQVLAVLLSLTLLRLRLDLDTAQLVELVSEAMNEGEYDELRIPEADQVPFANRLTKLLSSESLLYPAKAPSVIQAHEYLFAHARIVTDIRPIFGSDITIKPVATAIIHTLQLTCHHGDGVKNFYIAMDKSDLDLLKGVLERAVLKADNLGSFLLDSGMATVWE